MKSLHGFLICLTHENPNSPIIYIGHSGRYRGFSKAEKPQTLVQDQELFESVDEATIMMEKFIDIKNGNKPSLGYDDEYFATYYLSIKSMLEKRSIRLVDIREFCEKRYSLSVLNCDTGEPKITLTEAWVGSWYKQKSGYATPEEALSALQKSLDQIAGGRRHKEDEEKFLTHGDISLSVSNRYLSGSLGNRYLSPIETSLMAILMDKKGSIATKDELKLHGWPAIKVTDTALHRKLHAIRDALRDVSDQVVLHTSFGIGFCLKDYSQRLQGE